MAKYLLVLLFTILSPIAFSNPPTTGRNVSSEDNAVEQLLKNYNPALAKRAAAMIKHYKERKDVSSKAMTDVARTIFLMYGLNPDDITASYGGTVSKAVIDKSSGKVRICVAEKRNAELEHHEKAYGNDTFMHEMLHALGFKWKANGIVKRHGLSHSNAEEKVYFEKCRKILVSAIHDISAQEKLFKQKFENLLKNDKQFSGNDEQVKKFLVRKYIKYRREAIKPYSRAKALHPLLAIQHIHSLGLPLDAEYVNGHFDGKKMWVVKVHVGSSIKKYKPDMVELYHDDIIRAINKQIQLINDELKAVRKDAYPKEKIIDFLNGVRFKRFKMRYWHRFTQNQQIEMQLPPL